MSEYRDVLAASPLGRTITMNEVWKIAIRATLFFMICVGILFLSSCGTRNCNTQEFLTNSLCR